MGHTDVVPANADGWQQDRGAHAGVRQLGEKLAIILPTLGTAEQKDGVAAGIGAQRRDGRFRHGGDAVVDAEDIPDAEFL